LLRLGPRHSWRCGAPQKYHFGGGEAVCSVNLVADLALQGLGFGGARLHRLDQMRVFFAQALERRGWLLMQGERLTVPDALRKLAAILERER